MAFTPVRSWAAEQLFFDFGPLSRSIPMASLEYFAETGEVDAALAPYFRKLTPAQQADLKTALTTTKPADVVTVSQFFYDPMGARSLDFMGNVIQTDGFLNGGKALRSALIASAANGEISLLSVHPTRQNRTVPVVLFVPENLAAAPSSLSVVVVSHGLGSSPNDFLEAGVIASYGFVVALPDHHGPGC